MKLLTNKNNSQALKPLIAASISNISLPVEAIESANDSRVEAPGLLPVLCLDTGEQIFSSNAATCFLLEKKNQKTAPAVSQWLEWEVTYLQVAVASCATGLTSGKKDSFTTDLKALLTTLSTQMGDKQYVIEKSLSAADISIWATLYPLASQEKLVSQLPPNIAKWFNNLSSQAAFKDALGKLQASPKLEDWVLSMNYLNVQLSNLSLTAPPAVMKSESAAPVKDKSSKGKSSAPGVSGNPVLPEPGKRNILITSALPYVNNVPHLGNIIGCVLSADVFARYCRARGYPTLYISGTDEYGTATETKAIAEGLTPQQICDKYHTIHAQVYEWFNIYFDHFGRTSSPQHTEICQDVFLKLHKNGLTLKESMEQLLCQKCDRFLADRFVEGECPLCGYEDARGDQCDKCGRLVNATELKKPRCKLCQETPVTRESTHFFLDLPKVEPSLRSWMAESAPGWSKNAQVIAQSWVKDGLKPRCITRDLKWGIPVPLDGYREKVFYVWFDAPLGYISMTKCYTEQWEKWWKNPKEVEYFQFMAKDNVPFHSVVFPSTLLGSKDPFTIVNRIMATEYLNYEEGKFSKSRGVGVFGSDVQSTGIPADVWRFYLLYVRPEGQDSSFSWTDLMTKNNSELLNNLGNFINRALMFVERSFDSKVPEIDISGAEDTEFLANVNEELAGYIEALEKCRLRDGLRYILSISRHGNQYIQSTKPWLLFKSTSQNDRNRAGSICGLSVNVSCLLAALLRPYMPETADIIHAQLAAPGNASFTIPEKFSIVIPSGHNIGKVAPLFSKIEQAQVDALRTRFAGDQQAQADRAAGATAKKSVAANSQGTVKNVTELQAAVTAQGEVVRKLKSETKDKTVWQPEVNKLLDLKKQLAEAEAAGASSAASLNNATKDTSPAAPTANLAALEAAIAAQGEVVRRLKAETKDKAVWQPAVNKLLELKQQFVQAGGTPSPAPQQSKKGKKK